VPDISRRTVGAVIAVLLLERWIPAVPPAVPGVAGVAALVLLTITLSELVGRRSHGLERLLIGLASVIAVLIVVGMVISPLGLTPCTWSSAVALVSLASTYTNADHRVALPKWTGVTVSSAVVAVVVVVAAAAIAAVSWRSATKQRAFFSELAFVDPATVVVTSHERATTQYELRVSSGSSLSLFRLDPGSTRRFAVPATGPLEVELRCAARVCAHVARPRQTGTTIGNSVTTSTSVSSAPISSAAP
jgi:hypothetical protein